MITEQHDHDDYDEMRVAGTDSGHVSVCLVVGDDFMQTKLTPEQAREISVRLLQAADLADPAQANRYTGGMYR